uniref:Uncharacterized protein n=1 Tax=Megaselia scalaris TaxID=36166 RepID=T1GZ46_MEGSC
MDFRALSSSSTAASPLPPCLFFMFFLLENHQGEVNVFPGVKTENEKWEVDNSLADTDMSLTDQNMSIWVDLVNPMKT